MIEPGTEAFEALYCDDTANPVGLDEVQLLEVVSPERRSVVERLVRSDDEYVRYQATLLLVAWGDRQGVIGAERFVADAALRTTALAPYRLGGQDMAYDELAEALAVAASIRSEDADRGAPGDLGDAEIRRLTRALLRLVPEEDFRSGLRALLLQCVDLDLVDDVVAAVRRAISAGRHGLASELLEPIAVVDSSRFWSLFDFMTRGDRVPPAAEANVCDALAHVPGPRGVQLLDDLQRSRRPGVAKAARAARRVNQGDDDADRR